MALLPKRSVGYGPPTVRDLDFMDIAGLLALELLNNPLRDWLTALAMALTVNLVVALVKWLARVRLAAVAQRTATKLDDAVVIAVRRTQQWLVLIVSIYLMHHYLEVPQALTNTLRIAAIAAAFLQVGLWLGAMVEFWGTRSKQRALEHDPSTATTLGAVKFVAKVLVWTVLLLLALDNMGVDVTALVAGLGVGGIAVALAVQNILGDLFASLSIVIDKPFVLGDFVIVDDYLGTVEHIGLKTTRIRSLSGEQLVFANSDLLNCRLRNFKRMQERRILFRFGVVYQTKADKLERIPQIVREIVCTQDMVRFDRAHFAAFGDSSYDFEVVYWMLDPDFVRYMDTQEAINLAMVRAFEREGIVFAYPTRTLHVESLPAGRADKE